MIYCFWIFITVENNVTEYSPVGRVEKGDDVSRASSSGGSGTDAGSSSSGNCHSLAVTFPSMVTLPLKT